MDTDIYSDDTIEKFIKNKVCQKDATLYTYYKKNQVKKFRERLNKVGDQELIDKVTQTICTDVLRRLIYDMIRRMYKKLLPYGKMIVSGGEAFNIYLPKGSRVITSDIDTKFVPRINKDDPKAFGKLQMVRLALWNEMGHNATLNNNKSMTSYNNKLKKNKIASLLGLTIKSNSPFRIRYSLLPKLRTGKHIKPKTGDVFMDVDIFAVDLLVKHYNIAKKGIVEHNIGGILDIPIIRRKRFSSNVEVDYVRNYKPLSLPLASKRFLIEDLDVLIRFGIRTGDKLRKDKERMFYFIRDVLGLHVTKSMSFTQMYNLVDKHIPLTSMRSPSISPSFPLCAWKKLNPRKYEDIVTQASRRQLTFLLYPLLENKLKMKKVTKDYYFSPQKERWVKISKKIDIGNILNQRPDNNRAPTQTLENTRSQVFKLLKK